jgi:hypothetical protein
MKPDRFMFTSGEYARSRTSAEGGTVVLEGSFRRQHGYDEAWRPAFRSIRDAKYCRACAGSIRSPGMAYDVYLGAVESRFRTSRPPPESAVRSIGNAGGSDPAPAVRRKTAKSILSSGAQ